MAGIGFGGVGGADNSLVVGGRGSGDVVFWW